MSGNNKRTPTVIVEGGRRKEWRSRLVNVPVERASTILFDSVAELESNAPGLGIYRYGLQGTATHWALSEALTELEPAQPEPHFRRPAWRRSPPLCLRCFLPATSCW